MKKSFQEVDEIYELEADKIIRQIKKFQAKKILLQFPEGLKPYAQVIADEISKQSKADCFIWLGSCFGGCDVPDAEGVDLIVQFGHSEWKNLGR